METDLPVALLLFGLTAGFMFSRSTCHVSSSILLCSVEEDLQSCWRMAASAKAGMKVSDLFVSVVNFGA
jgi:hypothetical protein